MEEFSRIQRLPPYVFAVVGDLKMKLRRQNIDIVDFSMGNPDIPTPPHIVDKLVEAAQKPVNHRYSLSRGIPHLRDAVCERYKRLYDVDLDPNTEAIVTMGSKEGLAHLSLAMLSPGDVVLAPDPTYPIHKYAPIIAGADVRSVPIGPGRDFFEDLTAATKQAWPRPKLLFLCYPHNPTTEVTDLAFFEKVVEFAKENNIWVIHDLAYADLVFDGYKAPSFLQAKGAKDVGVEFYSLSKSYNYTGARMSFVVGNQAVIDKFKNVRSQIDYGIFLPVQYGAIAALTGPQDAVKAQCEEYDRRNHALSEGLTSIGWKVPLSQGTMFSWAQIPEGFANSNEFVMELMEKTGLIVTPGSSFGSLGEGFVRFALVLDVPTIQEAVRSVKESGILNSRM